MLALGRLFVVVVVAFFVVVVFVVVVFVVVVVVVIVVFIVVVSEIERDGVERDSSTDRGEAGGESTHSQGKGRSARPNRARAQQEEQSH